MEPLGAVEMSRWQAARLGEAFPHAIPAEDLKQESGIADPEAGLIFHTSAASLRPKIAKAACGGGFSVVLSSEGEAPEVVSSATWAEVFTFGVSASGRLGFRTKFRAQSGRSVTARG